MERQLPEEFKHNIENGNLMCIEFAFHSSDYEIMQKTTTGLRTAVGHLVQVMYTLVEYNLLK